MTVSIPGDVDPEDHHSVSAFKAAVYDAAGGAGSWIDDIRLDAVWRSANGKDLESHHEAVLGE